MENTRKQINYNQIVGIIGNDIYMLDYTFSDGKDFKGATGTVFNLVSKEQYEETMDNQDDLFLDMWKDAVANNTTEQSFKDWFNDISDDEKLEINFDQSYSEYHDEIREIMNVSKEDYPVICCTGGGRCFKKGMKFDKVFNKKLIAEINKFEK